MAGSHIKIEHFLISYKNTINKFPHPRKATLNPLSHQVAGKLRAHLPTKAMGEGVEGIAPELRNDATSR